MKNIIMNATTAAKRNGNKTLMPSAHAMPAPASIAVAIPAQFPLSLPTSAGSVMPLPNESNACFNETPNILDTSTTNWHM